MKKLIKFFGIAFVCLLSVALLCACNNTDKNTNDEEECTEPTGHVHNAEGNWEVDKDTHWRICTEDQEKTDLSEHTLENGVCTTCKVTVETQGDKTVLMFKDDFGNWTTRITYNADGTVVEDFAEYLYDSKQNVVSIKITLNGKLTSEAEYGVDEEGYNYEKKVTEYLEDGTKVTYEYSNVGDTLRETKYKADGTIESDLTTVHEYDENGKKKSEKTYNGDKLVQEVKYVLVTADAWGGGIYNREVTTYLEDGTTRLVIYNENGEVVDATN